MKINTCVSSIRRHLDNADETVDRETKALEQKFARMFLERLRLECAGLADDELMAHYPDAYHLLKRGLSNSAPKLRLIMQGEESA